MRYGDLRVMKKWCGRGTPIGGWLYGDPGKWRMIFIFELGPYVEMA